MRNRIQFYRIFIFIGLFANSTTNVLSATNQEIGNELPEGLNEKYLLLTDRNIYAVEEIIHFMAIDNSNSLVKEKNWSKVLYVELLDDKGTAFYKGKFMQTKTGFNGAVKIPDNLPTGKYYLAAYTKWMRNFAPSGYSITKIKVINPYAGTTIQNSRNQSKPAQNLLAYDEKKISCKLDKPKYGKREKVEVTFQFPETWNPAPINFCVTVVKPGTIDTIDYGIANPGIVKNKHENGYTYVPELQGNSISGVVLDKTSKNPLQYADVQLSVFGEKPDFFSYKTNSDGKFVFSLQPTFRKNEMFITCANSEEDNFELRIDNDFSTQKIQFDNTPFQLSDEEIKTAEEIMFNMQVDNTYCLQSQNNSPNGIADTVKQEFYGPPTNLVVLKKYIELPTLSEVFFELIPEVLTIKRKGETHLEVQGEIEFHPDFSLFKPLVLMDRVPVHNLEEMLRISPIKIDRIEVVNKIYIKGNNKYGGIIAVYSKNNDMAGLNLPKNSMFFNFAGYEPHQPNQFLGQIPAKENKNIPYFRNCLYWNPGIVAIPGTEQNIEFRVSDVVGEYMVLIRGISEEGKIMEGRAVFLVE